MQKHCDLVLMIFCSCRMKKNPFRYFFYLGWTFWEFLCNSLNPLERKIFCLEIALPETVFLTKIFPVPTSLGYACNFNFIFVEKVKKTQQNINEHWIIKIDIPGGVFFYLYYIIDHVFCIKVYFLSFITIK